MSSAAFSGKNGKVTFGSTDIVDTRKWNLKVENMLSEYASNATAGWFAAVAGTSKWSGDFNMLSQGGAPPISAGTSYTVHLYEDASHQWTGLAWIESISPKVDVETGKVVEYDVNFKGGGVLTPPS